MCTLSTFNPNNVVILKAMDDFQAFLNGQLFQFLQVIAAELNASKVLKFDDVRVFQESTNSFPRKCIGRDSNVEGFHFGEVFLVVLKKRDEVHLVEVVQSSHPHSKTGQLRERCEEQLEVVVFDLTQFNGEFSQFRHLTIC